MCTGNILFCYWLHEQNSVPCYTNTANITVFILQFGIYASGLESLLGQEADSGDEEATAGLGLKILDVLLPPVEFFRGSGGLMSAVWNAPSDPVTALQVCGIVQLYI